MLGAMQAGIAFTNASVALVHGMSRPIGAHFHVPHGLSNALMLAHVIGHNMPAAMPLYAELGAILDPRLAGLGAQGAAQGFVEALIAIGHDCGVPGRLRDVGVAASDLDLLAAEAMKQQRLLINNPCEISLADARRLYEAAL